ncbi:hypothetical protein TWF730_000548 [Orbilia blumenaviensis]|uniref:Uncharacterized protein n=1 Tax=Orbilia blumenaviensis TaxID=1796055 RepID=A0AAV9VM42_9PEZI
MATATTLTSIWTSTTDGVPTIITSIVTTVLDNPTDQRGLPTDVDKPQNPNTLVIPPLDGSPASTSISTEDAAASTSSEDAAASTSTEDAAASTPSATPLSGASTTQTTPAETSVPPTIRTTTPRPDSPTTDGVGIATIAPTGTGSNGTSSGTTETPQLNQDNSLPGGVVAGIVVGVIGAVAVLVIVGIYLIRRRKRRYVLEKEEESNPGAMAIESGRHNRGAGNSNPNPAPPVRFDDPLDDVGVKKLFDQLDDRISDHVVNFGLQGSPESSGLTKEAEASTENILFRGQALLGRQDSRLYMLRALFAYHIFGSVADQMIFTKEQTARGDRATRRAVICRQLENKELFASAVEFLYGHLNRETQIYVPEDILKSENYQASLGAIARNTANVIIRLGLQPSSFKLGFLFQSNNYRQVEGVIPCEASAIREFKADSGDYDISGEVGHESVASAMISPSVYRRPNGENHKYKLRNMKIFMTPRTLKRTEG